MSRSHWARGTFLLTLLAAMAGCQDYNFNPVGHCLIQPGSERVTLSNISSADVLFVVDDSGSMGAEQDALASNFATFIGELDEANAARRQSGLEPFDFHIAVTTTSMFFNQYTDNRPNGPWTCSSSCPGATGRVCCTTDADNVTPLAPARVPRACTSNTDCTAGTTCRTDCRSPYTGGADLFGEKFCCDATGGYPSADVLAQLPCAREGTECGSFERHYNFAGCGAAPGENQSGVGVAGWPYPQGDFVSWTGTTTANPRVLHFDKELYPEVANPSATNKQGFTRAELISFFQNNVKVGVCGSGEEQPLAAAQAAIEKARGGAQKDTYARTSARTQTWDPAARAASSPAEWLVPGASSKLVVVFVGDEDDCSPTVADPSASVVWDFADRSATGDSCGLDADRAAPYGGKLQSIDTFVNYFTGLGREVAAAFILPAAENSCTIDTCTANGLCCPPATSCGMDMNNGAQSFGTRLVGTARALQTKGVDVVAGSICDGSFGTILVAIAELVKPPTGLTLPSAPAAGEVTVLRIVRSSGETRKTCNGPVPPGLTADAAATARDANGNLYDWWFTPTADPGGSVAVSANIYINPNGACKANPGETYSADYLGRVPAGGCRSDADCDSVLGGAAGSWTCFAGVTGNPEVCVNPATSTQPGTCICGERAQNCPNG